MTRDGPVPGGRSPLGKLRALAGNVAVFGLVDTARAVLAHAGLAPGRSPDRFDRRYGVATAGEIEVADSDLAGPSREHAIAYQPTHERVLRHVLAHLPVDPAGHEFVDLGCGKGRALIMAAEQPWRRIVGVELSPAYCAAARENLARCRWPPDRPRRCHDIEVVQADVTELAPPAGDAVVFLFNPFRRPVLQIVFERLAASMRAAPKSLLVAYCNPWEGAGLLDELGYRKLSETQVISPEWSWSLWEPPRE